MQFIIIARDNSAPGTSERRQQVRAEHLANLRKAKASGNYIFGGAMLDADGEAFGSVVIMDFPDRAALEDWMQTEPFVRDKIWDKIEISNYRVAPI